MMRTKQRSSQCRVPRASLLLTLTTIILFSCSQRSLAQQRDGEATNADSNSSNTAPNRSAVNFNFNFANLTLLNGEFLEAFGANNSRGILRGHPTIPGTELGTTTADPFMFSTNSVERMRIASNGNVGIGTSTPQDAFHVFNTTNTVGTIRLQGGNTYAGFIGVWEGDQSLLLTNNRHPGTGNNYNTARIGAQLSLWGGDIHFYTTASGTVGTATELMRIKPSGNVGIGTPTPAFRLDVQGGAVNAAGGLCIAGDCKTAWSQVSPPSSQWTTSGTSIFYNSGNVGIGTETPGARLHVSAGNSSFALFGPNVEWGGSLAVGSGTSFMWPISGRAQVLSSNGNLHLDAGTNQNVYIGWFNAGHTIINAQGGNVGIGTGTVTPTRRLDLFSDVAGISFEAGTGSPNSGVIRFGDGSGWKLHFGRSRNPGALNSGTDGVLMTVQDNGNVGIGTAAPGHKLEVAGTIRSSNGGFVFPDGTVQTTAGGGPSSQWTTSGVNIFYNSGNVGIGTPTPASNLQIGTQAFVASATPTTLSLGGSHSNAAGANLKLKLYDDGVAGNTYGLGVSASSMDFGVPSGVTYKWYGGGVNKMTLTTNGDLSVSGSIAAKYQDVAEWVDSSQELVAGTVVVLDSSRSNNVIAATQSYDSRIAGVISLQPGLTLGEKAEGRVLVATTGRVRVKVDATEGAIQIGDLLVTSNREGFAMKSLPVDLGGVRMHRPGTLIGKALEPLISGTGQILVLLSLQ